MRGSLSSGLWLKKLDKKAKRILLHCYGKGLTSQVAEATDPVALLPKVVALIFVQVHNRALQAPGRAIAAAITRLKGALPEESFTTLMEYHAATVQLLALQAAANPKENDCASDIVITKGRCWRAACQICRALFSHCLGLLQQPPTSMCLAEVYTLLKPCHCWKTHVFKAICLARIRPDTTPAHVGHFDVWEGRLHIDPECDPVESDVIHNYVDSSQTLKKIGGIPWRGREKSPAFMQTLIETCSRHGGKVVDLSMGTGASFHACKYVGRHFFGMEGDEQLYSQVIAPLSGGSSHSTQTDNIVVEPDLQEPDALDVDSDFS